MTSSIVIVCRKSLNVITVCAITDLLQGKVNVYNLLSI